MTHQNSGEIEELVTNIIKQNPRLSTTGIINKLNANYGRKISHPVAIKIINRMVQFDGLRMDLSRSGVVVYFFAEEA